MNAQLWAGLHTMVVFVATCGALGSELAHASLIVVPNALTTVEGNSNLSFPGTNPGRLRQVYAASEFASLPEPVFVTQIAYRPDGIFGESFSRTIADIQINLSTTSAAPDGLSATYDANVGADDTVVFHGPLTISSSNTGPPQGPKDFDILIGLQTPFFYDPRAGNLLLDYREFIVDGFPLRFLDTQDMIGDSISEVSGFGFTTGFTHTDGFVTRFQFEASAIPEPATLWLLGLGLAGLLCHRLWRAHKEG